MKRFTIVLLGIFMAFCMVACQSEPSAPKNEEDQDMSSRQTEEIENDSLPETTIADNTTKPQARENCDFRNAKWGDSQEDVKKYETEIKELFEEKGTLLGETNVSGYSAVAGFLFEKGKLYSGAYMFSLNYSNAGQYILAYDLLKDNLIKKYGEPNVDGVLPLADQDLIEYAGDANALEFGYVMYGATWETDTTSILMSMMADDYEINLRIQYFDKEWEQSVDNSF